MTDATPGPGEPEAAPPDEPTIKLAAPTGTTLPGSTRPKVRRLSKNLGIAAFVIVIVLVGAILLGVVERQRLTRAQAERGSAVAETRAAPATAAASQVTQGIGNGSFAKGPGGVDNAPNVDGAPGDGSPGTPTTRTASGLVVPAGGPSATTTSTGGANALPPPTPEERALEQAYRDELDAMKAGTAAGTKLPAAGFVSASPGAGSAAAGLPPELLASVGALTGSRPIGAPATAVLASMSEDDRATQNGWARKREFGNAARGAASTGRAPQAAASPYLIRAGWTIPAILEQDLNSDLPGEIRALVTQNVYDTATGEYLLIPQGTRLIGTYDSAVGYGQGALQAIWIRLVFPDASVLDLGAGRAQDASGRAGLRFRTNYHSGRLLGAALLTSFFSAGYEIAQGNRGGTVLDGSSVSDRAARGAAEEITRLGADVARRTLNIAPTIEIPAGFRLQVFVAEDLSFETPYPSE
jgi:type IV secretion system protein VirB10